MHQTNIKIVALLSSKQIRLATDLIKDGYSLEETKDRNILKLNKGKTKVTLFPPKQKENE